MEAWRCQIIQLGVTHSGGEEAGLGTGSLSQHLHSSCCGSRCALPRARSRLRRWRLVKKWEADRGRSLFTSHALCFLKSQGPCNFLSCRFPTWRISDRGGNSACEAPRREDAPGAALGGQCAQSLILIKANTCACVISYNAFFFPPGKQSFSRALTIF